MCLVFGMVGLMAQAQQQVRIGFLDIDRVLAGVSEYQASNAQLETKIALWKEEAETRQKQIDTLQKVLDTERPLLTQEIIEERTEDIAFEQEQLDAFKPELINLFDDGPPCLQHIMTMGFPEGGRNISLVYVHDSLTME